MRFNFLHLAFVANQTVNMISETDRQIVSKMIGDYLLNGYTMLNESCSNCHSVMMRRKDEDSFCVYCRDIVKDNDSMDSKEESFEIEPQSCDKGLWVVLENQNVNPAIDAVMKTCSNKLISLSGHFVNADLETGERLNQHIQSIMKTIEQAIKLREYISKLN